MGIDGVGLATGGVWGFKEGWSRQLGQGASFKLRLNSILNGCTRRGTLLGNSLGVLGMSKRFSFGLQTQQSFTTLQIRQWTRSGVNTIS